MAIPRAVQRKAEQARQIAQQQAAQQAARQGQPVHQAPSMHVTTNEMPTGQSTEVVAQEVQVQETVVSAMESNQIPMDDYKTRYSKLRTARDEKREAALKQVSDLEEKIAKLEAERVAPTPEEGQAPSDPQVSETAVASTTQVTETVDDSEMGFFADLESVVPDWEAINRTAGFIQWLQAADGHTGRSRQESLAKARAELDATTAINLFGGYVRELQQASVQPAVNESSERVAPAAPVSTVEPVRGSVISDPASGVIEQQVYSVAEIKQFRDTKNRLSRKRKMTPDLRAQFEAEEVKIMQAYKEGRVR